MSTKLSRDPNAPRCIGGFPVLAATARANRNGEATGIALLDLGTGRATVIHYCEPDGQVYNAMPGDRPIGGGSWFGRMSEAGVRYVAGSYSRSYARRVYRRLTAEV